MRWAGGQGGVQGMQRGNGGRCGKKESRGTTNYPRPKVSKNFSINLIIGESHKEIVKFQKVIESPCMFID